VDPQLYMTVDDAVTVAAGVESAKAELRNRGEGNAIVADLRTTAEGVALLSVSVRPLNHVVNIVGIDFLTMGRLTQIVALTFDDLM